MCCDAQVIVATAPMAWGMTAAAQLVVVMGTQARPRLRTLPWVQQGLGTGVKLSRLGWWHTMPMLTDVS